MKKFLLSICLVLCSVLNVLAQHTEADKIIGTYLTENKNAKVAITKSGNKYVGKLVWTKTQGKLDTHNPKAAERTKPLVGKSIVYGFTYSGKNVWENGKIYDPENGKTYSCKITMKSKGDLTVRGFIGISLLGRNTAWTRIK